MASSADWELGQLYWDERGSDAFLSDEVPYIINNDGNLSWNAAEVFFVSLVAAEERGTLEPQIFALELGIGLGLFARYFLDVFRFLCLRHGKTFYDHFCYLGVDRSDRMLADVRRHEILAGHQGHYQLLRGNAFPLEFEQDSPLESSMPPSNGLHAIFLNYALDSLPAAVLKVDEQPIRQLCVRTCLARGVELTNHTELTAEDLVRLAASPDPAEKRQLLELYPLFALDLAYRPVEDLSKVPHGAWAIQSGRPEDPFVLLNYGALQCLESCLTKLREDGFVLLNDYRCSPAQETEGGFRHQHFGGSTAIGVNFPLIKSHFQHTPDCVWVEPAEDNDHICGRLLGRKPSPETIACFQQVFSKAAFEAKQRPVEQARAWLKEGRQEAALQAYGEALNRQPNNWALMAEIAEMLTFTLRNYQAGLEMAQAGLALNPINPQLLNVFGDSLFCLERFEEAHDAFCQALVLDPQNVRARYNLVYTFAHDHDYAAALKMIAEGLAHDKTGEYRERLLEKQTEILGRLGECQRQQHRRLIDRFVWCPSPETRPKQHGNSRGSTESCGLESCVDRIGGLSAQG
jgi:tetratricopeptide (TPR) repeat protein